MDEHLEHEQSQLNADCLNIIMTLRQTEQLSVASFVEAVHSVQRYIKFLQRTRQSDPDAMYTAQLVSAVKFNTNHFIVKAVAMPDEPKSMALLQVDDWLNFPQ